MLFRSRKGFDFKGFEQRINDPETYQKPTFEEQKGKDEIRPSSKGRSLMSRGENNKEMKNYEKLFFGKMDNPKFVAPVKTYNKGDILPNSNVNLDKVDQSDQLLNTETELIDIGCIDPNKSLYLGDTTANFRGLGRSPQQPPAATKKRVEFYQSEDSPARNEDFKTKKIPSLKDSQKPDDTLQYLDKLAGQSPNNFQGRKFDDSLEVSHKFNVPSMEERKAVNTLDFLDKIANEPLNKGDH